MVDVSAKASSRRVARAEALFRLEPEVRRQLLAGELRKGEALAVARVAGIQAAKETSRLIPLCHPIALSHAAVDFAAVAEDGILIRTEAVTTGPTGVEMEALAAATVAGLTLYDMCKSACREARLEQIRLVHKSGGKSGTWNATVEPTTGDAL
ncbi:MAG: cyclic pyranopterin monophosphate synthase MoaC [Planctomycetes bacterium]|nr:cyclic pyranopterin monophosphate synthase MoaC [Planctomycetota bacterium]